jgi:ParB family chromosome partitioning protein
MSKKQHNIKLDYKPGVIDINKIDPSPFQCRKFSDEAKLKELAASIDRDGLIEPIVVRPKGKRYEIIVGHRRVQAVRDYTDWKTIPAQIIKVDDLQARRI